MIDFANCVVLETIQVKYNKVLKLRSRDFEIKFFSVGVETQYDYVKIV